MSSTGSSERQNLLERGEEVAQTGSWEWDAGSGELLWSENLYRIFGLEPGEIAPTIEYVVGRTHPDDRALIEERLTGGRQRGRIPPFEYRIVRADGEVRHLRALQAVVGAPGAEGQTLVGSVQDVTDWRRAERQIAAHLAVSETLADWDTLEHGLEKLLARMCQALDCTAGVVWVPRGEDLVARTTWRSRAPQAVDSPVGVGDVRTKRGGGLARSVWETRRPGAGAEKGSSGVVALPLLFGDEVLGVFEFFGDRTGLDVTERLMQSLTAIGYEVGQFLSRRRATLGRPGLSARELEVLQLAARGMTARDIAAELVLSPATVSTHLKNVYEKYEVSDRASAVAKALREGLIE